MPHGACMGLPGQPTKETKEIRGTKGSMSFKKKELSGRGLKGKVEGKRERDENKTSLWLDKSRKSGGVYERRGGTNFFPREGGRGGGGGGNPGKKTEQKKTIILYRRQEKNQKSTIKDKQLMAKNL